MEPKKSYSISTNEERYHGEFDSEEEACLEAAANEEEGAIFWVGEAVPPPSPEGYFYAWSFIENVQCQDDYSGDHAEGWCGATKEQAEELEAEVQAIIGKWLDKYGLRPSFLNVTNAKRFRCLGDGKYEPAPE